jgi:hypothetical protein
MFDGDVDTLRKQFEMIFGIPLDGFLVLIAVLVNALFEIALAMQQRHATIGTRRSAADRIVSPASTPSPPLYVGISERRPISIEKYAIVRVWGMVGCN